MSRAARHAVSATDLRPSSCPGSVARLPGADWHLSCKRWEQPSCSMSTRYQPSKRPRNPNQCNLFVFRAVRRLPGRFRPALSKTERVRRIGALTSLAEGSSEGQVWYAAFTNGLVELAWTVSHNVQFAYRWA